MTIVHPLKQHALWACLLPLLFFGCKEEEPEIGTDLRVLTITANGNPLANNTSNLDPLALNIELVFSHSVDIGAVNQALTISGNPTFEPTYTLNNSILTLDFDTLAFEGQYTLALPTGTYGAGGEALAEGVSIAFSMAAYEPPALTLAANVTELLEGETATITATLGSTPLEAVSANLVFGGTATGNGTDYTASASTLSFAIGQTTTTFTLEALNDADIEGEESITVTLADLTNAVEASPQTVNLALKDEVPALELKGALALRWEGEPDGNAGKAVHLRALDDIADLSVYALGVANNGGGTDSIEVNLPAVAVAAGEDILVARNPSALEAYFGATCYSGFEHVVQADGMNQNGDDAIELYKGTIVIETYGDINVDGTGEAWEYASAWAYKLGSNWTTGGVGCTTGSTGTMGSGCVYPMCDNALALKGIMALRWSTEPDGNAGKALHLVANASIADLSTYAIGITNNGGGSDGIEYTLPATAVAEGDHILLARNPEALSAYFGNCHSGFTHVFQTDAMNQNGDDGAELFLNGSQIEVYGSIDDDGTGLAWEYTGGWAFKVGSTWSYSGLDCAATATDNSNADCPYTFCQ